MRKTETYFTGVPCRYGHISERYAITKVCVECGKKWQLENKEDRKEFIKHIKYRLGSMENGNLSNKDLNDFREELVFYANIISWSFSVKKEDNENNI
jgi:hypothetical protein